MKTISAPNILLTGITGFLGSNLAEAFAARGWQVTGVVRESSSLRRISRLIEAKKASTILSASAKQWLTDHSDAIIVHTATNYGRKGEAGEVIREANFGLPAMLLDAARSNKTAFLNADTFMPNSTLSGEPYYDYCRTKKDFLDYALRSRREGGKFVNLVIYHMYGPDDNPEKFIPVALRKLLDRVPSMDLTGGRQTRDFIFISDVADAFVSAIERLNEFSDWEEFDIGTGTEHSLRELVSLLKEEVQGQTELNWGALPYHEHELMRSRADISKNSKLGWQAGMPLKRGLKLTVAFYSRNSITSPH